MRRFYGFLLLALGAPSAAWAQTEASLQAGAEYLATRAARPQVYVGVAAAMPVYWREPIFRDNASGWGFVAAFAGVQFSSRWAAQVGFNRWSLAKNYDVYPAPTPGPMPLPIGTGHFEGTAVALPVLLRYQPGWRLSDFAIEGFAGVTPHWQQYQAREVATVAGQPANAEMTTQFRTTQLHATVGVAGVFNAGVGADFLVEGALNQRVLSTGNATTAPTLAPTLALSFRYRFGNVPHRSRYLAD